MQATTQSQTTVNDRQASASTQLEPDARVPLYHQLFMIMRGRIYNGEHAVNERLPSEQELCTEFGVSRITAKRALDELAEAGLVIRERGRGTRVVSRPPSPTVTSSIEGWLENISLMGMTTTAKVLSFDYVAASPEAAQALRIEPGTLIQRSVRVRILDGEPMSYLTTFVPEDIGRQYDHDDLNVQPLLHLLERAGVNVTAAQQTISAEVADAEVARALGIQVGAPLIKVVRVVEDNHERPVEFIRILYRPDLYQFEMSMRRIKGKEGMTWSTNDA